LFNLSLLDFQCIILLAVGTSFLTATLAFISTAIPASLVDILMVVDDKLFVLDKPLEIVDFSLEIGLALDHLPESLELGFEVGVLLAEGVECFEHLGLEPAVLLVLAQPAFVLLARAVRAGV
jgi:hypothetical protein